MRDIPSRPIYGVGERSGIRIRRVAPRIAWLLFKAFWWRMKEKYVIRDFHPLVFFYTLGFLMSVVGFLLGLVVAASRIFWGNEITTATIVLVALLLVSGTQFTLFAMWLPRRRTRSCAEARRDAVSRAFGRQPRPRVERRSGRTTASANVDIAIAFAHMPVSHGRRHNRRSL